MKREISVKVIQRIEMLEGQPVGEALAELYTRQQLTYRMLCKRWGVQNTQLIKLMKHYGVEPRKGGEAIKVQWIGNTERRLAAAAKLGEISRDLVAQGRHARLGLNKHNSESIRQMALKSKQTTSFHDPAVVRKCVSTRIQRHLENPATHPNAKALPSKREQIMLDHFTALGYKTEFSYYLPPYWLDVYLPELGIGIECVNSKRPAWARHEAITQQGAHMLYVLNDFIDQGDFRQVDEYVTNFKTLSMHSAFRHEDAMVWGSKYVFFFPDQPDNVLIEVIRMENLYCLRITDITII